MLELPFAHVAVQLGVLDSSWNSTYFANVAEVGKKLLKFASFSCTESMKNWGSTPPCKKRVLKAKGGLQIFFLF